MPTSLVQTRTRQVLLWTLTCFVALLARLLYLQGPRSAALSRAAALIGRETIDIPAGHGAIYDRNGIPLAMSLYDGTLGFDTVAERPIAEHPRRTLVRRRELADSISRAAAIVGQPTTQVAATIQAAVDHNNPRRPSRFVVIQRHLSFHEAQLVRAARPPLLGFAVEAGSRRAYADGASGAQVLGFVAPDGHPLGGLELAYKGLMEGRKGQVVAQVDSSHREIPDSVQDLTPAQDGLDLHTTLDAVAEQVAQEEAERCYETYHPRGVSVVIVDPMSGDILALVSAPTFNPNPGASQQLLPGAHLERCASIIYEPGSTLKAMTISAALQEHVIGLDSKFFCGGTLRVGNKLIHCVLHGAAERYGHGWVTPRLILVHSCNIGAALIGMKMGPRLLFDYFAKFGLFDPPSLGLPNEAQGRLSWDPSENIYTDAKVGRAAFGQSITTTPLRLVMAYSAVVNGGLLMKPRLVVSATAGSGEVRRSWPVQVERRVISQQVSREVREMLCGVVADGTGKAAAIPGYFVGGKTGTAQKYRPGAYVGSFIGFAPAGVNSVPRMVVLVTVDEPRGQYYGAEVAAPAVRAILRRLLACWRVPEDDSGSTQAREALGNLWRMGEAPAELAQELERASPPHDH